MVQLLYERLTPPTYPFIMILVSEKNTRCNSMCLPSWRHFKCSTRVARPLYLVSHSKETKLNSRTMITGPTIVNWGAAKYSSIELDSLSSCQKVKQLSFKRCLQLPPSIVVVCFCALLLERAVCSLSSISLSLPQCVSWTVTFTAIR